MRSGQRVVVLAAIVIAFAVPPSGGCAASVLSTISLPPDFTPRFIAACMRRGLTEARCACMSEVVLREVADEHLALMIDYFENPTGFDTRAMQELDNDEDRMRVLEAEIASAQNVARGECRTR